MNRDDPCPSRPPSNGDGRRVEIALITAAELAQTMQISVRTLWRLRSAGRLIEPVKIGGNTRWRLDEVRQWIGDGCPTPAGRDN